MHKTTILKEFTVSNLTVTYKTNIILKYFWKKGRRKSLFCWKKLLEVGFINQNFVACVKDRFINCIIMNGMNELETVLTNTL